MLDTKASILILNFWPEPCPASTLFARAYARSVSFFLLAVLFSPSSFLPSSDFTNAGRFLILLSFHFMTCYFLSLMVIAAPKCGLSSFYLVFAVLLSEIRDIGLVSVLLNPSWDFLCGCSDSVIAASAISLRIYSLPSMLTIELRFLSESNLGS